MANLRLADLETIVQTFDYLSPVVVDFGTLNPGDQIIETRIEIETIFDDPAATVSIGPVSNPDSLLATNQTDPSQPCDYVTQQSFKPTALDALRLKISAGTSTQGAGRAVIVLRRA
jgi:hypothetical protein